MRGDEPDCWGCDDEPAIDGSLGERCRVQLAQRREDPSTPRLNAMIQRLAADVYTRLCWDCGTELSTAISGLCPVCETEIRR